MPWIAISFELDPAPAEAISEALLETGADSVSLDVDGAQVRVTAILAAGADAAAVLMAAAGAAGLSIPSYRSAIIGDDDWVRRSQAQFGPICISPALWIVPSWAAPPDASAVVVRLDPGLAFGTGSHASTRLILRRLEALMRISGATRPRVLDYGCGSGILAIVAAKLGAGEVAAVDIDPQALEAATANASANDTTLDVAAPEDLAAGTYDIVLANILAGPLIALQPQLAARSRRGGYVLLSGILQSQAADVAAAYAPDFETSIGALDEGWALVEGRRR